jgi:hypothetical protein
MVRFGYANIEWEERLIALPEPLTSWHYPINLTPNRAMQLCVALQD